MTGFKRSGNRFFQCNQMGLLSKLEELLPIRLRMVLNLESSPMRARLLLVSAMISLFCYQGLAQKLNLDTVYVTYNKTSYLVFNHPFDPDNDFIDIESENYQSEIKGNTILLKSASPMVASTRFTIKNGQAFYSGFLAYKLNPAVTFYDYRNQEVPKFIADPDSTTLLIMESSSEPDLANSTLDEAMIQALMQRNPDVHTIGVAKGKIILALTNVMINDGITYLKILVNNRSAKRFDIDFTGFVYSEPASQKDSIKTKGRVMDISPILQTNVEVVNANQRRYLGYALPLPNVAKRSKLVVTIIERDTSQAISFDIPAGALLKTKLF